MTRSHDSGTPLARGPVYGLCYCLVGLCVGYGAYTIGGWPSAPVWLISALLFGAGIWTTVFTGAWLLVVKWAMKRARLDKE